MMSSIPPASNSELIYALPYPGWRASTSPFSSDRLPNLTLMHQLVGTLVKYGTSGRFEPYLAERWESSSDQKRWIFFLRSGLTCEDGTPIEASQYVKTFKLLLRSYARNSTPAVFAKLVGWDSFLNGDDGALGVRNGPGNAVEFIFTGKPFGLLDYLGMPYFGFYSSRDFEGDSWKDSARITSSGGYVLSPIQEGQDIVLRKRSGWFSARELSADSVRIKYIDFASASKIPAKNALLVSRLDGSEALPDGFVQVSGVPTILSSIVLSPFRQGSPFVEQGFRRSFVATLRNLQRQMTARPGVSLLTEKFYPSWVGKDVVGVEGLQMSPVSPNARGRPLTVMLHSSMPERERVYAKQLLTLALESYGLEFEFVPESEKVQLWEFDQTYDIRVPRVNIGGNLLSEAVRMMFCSKMGVSFPDPSGRICRITEDFESDQSSTTFQEYGDSFNQVLFEDAAVIPLFHTGWTWFLSPQIKSEGVSPSMAVPRFDLLELKQ